jgi:hypothetical protein
MLSYDRTTYNCYYNRGHQCVSEKNQNVTFINDSACETTTVDVYPIILLTIGRCGSIYLIRVASFYLYNKLKLFSKGAG